MPVRTRGYFVSAALRTGGLAALLVGLAPPILAQSSSSVTVDVADCAGLESAESRLACFGARVDAALKDRQPADDEQAEHIEPETPARTLEGRRSRGDGTARGRTREPAEDVRDDEYTGVIVEIRETLPNAYLITLDNGQVWQQAEPEQYPLRPGLEVRVYPSSWGRYYRLSGRGTGSYIKVRQVR